MILMKEISYVILGCLAKFLLSYYDHIMGGKKKKTEKTVAWTTFGIECFFGLFLFGILYSTGNKLNFLGCIVAGATGVETARKILTNTSLCKGVLEKDMITQIGNEGTNISSNILE